MRPDVGVTLELNLDCPHCPMPYMVRMDAEVDPDGYIVTYDNTDVRRAVRVHHLQHEPDG